MDPHSRHRAHLKPVPFDFVFSATTATESIDTIVATSGAALIEHAMRGKPFGYPGGKGVEANFLCGRGNVFSGEPDGFSLFVNKLAGDEGTNLVDQSHVSHLHEKPAPRPDRTVS